MTTPTASFAQQLRKETIKREAARINKMLAWMTPELALSVIAEIGKAQRDRLRAKRMAQHNAEGTAHAAHLDM